jgi:antitoxin component YwqK of YwqJK toxin-antitoxin module
MKKILILLFASLSTIIFSCGNPQNEEQTENGSSAFEQEEIVARKINPGEMYHDITYYQNGQIKMEGNMIDEKKQGKWMSFYEDGMPWSETYFEDGISEGPTTAWHSSGIKYYVGNYKNGQRSGNWKFYNEDGKLEKEENY